MPDNKLLEEFSARAALCGCTVCVAYSAEESQVYLHRIVESRGVRVAVKARSGLADRLDWRSHLEEQRVKVIETELVGWVLELSRGKEVPLERVADLISSATGRAVNADRDDILSAARFAIKEAYARADLGISEADFGIAETGALVSMEDAANDRLAAVLPRLHLVLLEFDSIVASLADAATKMKAVYGGIPGRKLPTFITHLTAQGKTGNGYRGRALSKAHPTEEHILIIRQ